jgi:uncharacterized repeat protein (TIGR01451 family)
MAFHLAWVRGLSALLMVITCMAWPSLASAQTFPSFSSAPTLVSGAALSQGAVYRFATVLPGIDALLTLAQFSNTTALLTNLDDNTTFPERFQPVITCADPTTNKTCFVRFDFQFVLTGTATATTVYGFVASAQDIDGNGTANSIREFAEFTGAVSVTVASPTLLVAGMPVAGGARYDQVNSSNNQASIGTSDQYEIYAHYLTGISSFSIIGGNVIGATTCGGAAAAACQRQNSYTFNPADAGVASVTVRKVSSGGTGTFTFTGSNGWQTQSIATVTPGATATSQSQGLLLASTATTLAEAAPTGFTLESITCTGLGTGSATPTLNGTSGGSVLLNAAATAAGNNVVCIFTNRRLLQAQLGIAKTDNVTTVAAGTTITYTVTASNGGPDAAAGAIVRDTPSAGLNCTSVTCSSSALNMCPAASFPFASLSAGITIGPSFPAGSTATLLVTCGVTATGQ